MKRGRLPNAPATVSGVITERRKLTIDTEGSATLQPPKSWLQSIRGGSVVELTWSSGVPLLTVKPYDRWIEELKLQ